MFLRVLLGALLAAVVLFVWGAVFWMALPFASAVMHPLPNGDALVRTLKESLPRSGVYLFPWPDETNTAAADPATGECDFVKKHREGPLVQLTYRTDGLDPMSAQTLLIGFGHLFVSALIAGGLLAAALPGLRSYGARVLFVFLLGVFASVAVDLAGPIWFHHPWEFPLMMAGFDTVNWLLAGLVLPWVIRPAKA
jgi:hypothetical protein